MDEKLESLRREVKKDPSDSAAALRLASALENAGRFDEAWELLESRDARPELAGLAARNPRGVLEKLRRLDYRSARIMIDRLATFEDSGIVLAVACSESDPVLLRHAKRALAHVVPEVEHLIRAGRTTEAASTAALSAVGRLIARGEKARAVALLPWLVPALASRSPALLRDSLEIVRRMTQRDGPPLDVDLLATLLQANEGEPT